MLWYCILSPCVARRYSKLSFRTSELFPLGGAVAARPNSTALEYDNTPMSYRRIIRLFFFPSVRVVERKRPLPPTLDTSTQPVRRLGRANYFDVEFSTRRWDPSHGADNDSDFHPVWRHAVQVSTFVNFRTGRPVGRKITIGVEHVIVHLITNRIQI